MSDDSRLCNCLPNECHAAPGWQCRKVATPGATIASRHQASEDSVGLGAESSRPRELLTSNLKNPRGERRCHVGNDANGNVFEPFVRAAWADAEIERLRAALKRIYTSGTLFSQMPAIARDALRTDDDPLKPLVDGPSQVETKPDLEACPTCGSSRNARLTIQQLREDLLRAKFAPIGDNHHNAKACPYCTPSVVETGPKPDAEKAPVISADPCPTGDWVHEEHNGKCVYCGAPMPSQSKASGIELPLPEWINSGERVCINHNGYSGLSADCPHCIAEKH